MQPDPHAYHRTLSPEVRQWMLAKIRKDHAAAISAPGAKLTEEAVWIDFLLAELSLREKEYQKELAKLRVSKDAADAT